MTDPRTTVHVHPPPRTHGLLLLGAVALLAGLFLLDRAASDDGPPPPSFPAPVVQHVVVTVEIVFPTDTPTPSPTATRTPAATTTPWPTKPTCVTPIPETGCRNRELPTAVPTLTPKPTESWCEDLLLRKDQDCQWKPAPSPTPTPTPTPIIAPTSAPLPEEGPR